MVAIAKEFQLGSDFPKIDQGMWRKQVEAELKGAPFDKRMLSRSYEGIELQALYTEETFPTAGNPAGLPGYLPFVRGAQPLGHVSTGWDVRQEVGDPTPERAAEAALEIDLRRAAIIEDHILEADGAVV